MAGNSAIPWIAVGLVDLQNAQAGPLVVAFQSTALAANQADPTPQIISDVTDEILGAVGFSGRYTMDASQGNVFPNLLPPNLKNMAVRKIVRILRGRLEMTLLPDQIEDERTYQRTLQLLRDGKYPVDATNNPSGSDISIKPGLVQMNCGQRRQFSPGQLWNI
jgi:hypothetical protein